MRKYLYLLICISLFASGCAKSSGDKNTMQEPLSAEYTDPVIGVKMSSGETVYTNDEYQQALLSVSGTTPTPEPTIEPLPELVTITSTANTSTDVTIREATDHASSVAAVAIVLRTILNQYLGDNYTADFRQDAGIVNIPENAINGSVLELESVLDDTAKQAGLDNYHITVNLISPAAGNSDLMDEPISSNITANVYNTEKTIELPQGTMVWKTKSGSKFHNKQKCGNTDVEGTTKITVEEAVNKYHLEACNTCYQGQY